MTTEQQLRDSLEKLLPLAKYAAEHLEGVFERTGDSGGSEEDDSCLESAHKLGLVESVSYDPEKHGEEIQCDTEIGATIWWWGKTEPEINNAITAAKAAIASATTWTRCSERMPTDNDADYRKMVWWLEQGEWVVDIFYSKPTTATHWQQTGLVRPEPPKETR